MEYVLLGIGCFALGFIIGTAFILVSVFGDKK